MAPPPPDEVCRVLAAEVARLRGSCRGGICGKPVVEMCGECDCFGYCGGDCRKAAVGYHAPACFLLRQERKTARAHATLSPSSFAAYASTHAQLADGQGALVLVCRDEYARPRPEMLAEPERLDAACNALLASVVAVKAPGAVTSTMVEAAKVMSTCLLQHPPAVLFARMSDDALRYFLSGLAFQVAADPVGATERVVAAIFDGFVHAHKRELTCNRGVLEGVGRACVALERSARFRERVWRFVPEFVASSTASAGALFDAGVGGLVGGLFADPPLGFVPMRLVKHALRDVYDHCAHVLRVATSTMTSCAPSSVDGVCRQAAHALADLARLAPVWVPKPGEPAVPAAVDLVPLWTAVRAMYKSLNEKLIRSDACCSLVVAASKATPPSVRLDVGAIGLIATTLWGRVAFGGSNVAVDDFRAALFSELTSCVAAGDAEQLQQGIRGPAPPSGQHVLKFARASKQLFGLIERAAICAAVPVLELARALRRRALVSEVGRALRDEVVAWFHDGELKVPVLDCAAPLHLSMAAFIDLRARILAVMLGEEECAACHKGLSRARACAVCHAVTYCDRECQRAHWKEHAELCKALKL